MKKGVGNARDIIPDTFGRLVYSGNLDVCQFWTILLLFLEKLEFKKTDFLIVIPINPIIQYA